MPEFLTLFPPDQARALLLDNFTSSDQISEVVFVSQSLGRVTASQVIAPQPLPAFTRSTVDGYAVRARDSYGASETLPGYFIQIGEVPMGATPEMVITSGECALIHTGGMIPTGADAVVMLEYSQPVKPGEIEIQKAVAIGENTLCVGEDVTQGQVVIKVGTRIRPAEIGGLLALGIQELRVVPKPRVGIISSGDEIIHPDKDAKPGEVRDINSYTLASLVTQAGGEPVIFGICPDRFDILLAQAQSALQSCDMVVITAGSSASTRDMTADVIARLGSPGVLVHGINTKPGKPTILGVCSGKVVIGLPGNPVSALVNGYLFVVPVIEKLLGLNRNLPKSSVLARLTVNLSSQAGREDWQPVKLIPSVSGWLAEPVFGKSNLIFSLASADGLIKIIPDANGLSVGEMVDVFLMR